MKNPEYSCSTRAVCRTAVDGTVGLLELLRRTTDIADLTCGATTQSIAIQRLITTSRIAWRRSRDAFATGPNAVGRRR